MYKNKERDETIVVEHVEPRANFLKVVEKIAWLLASVFMMITGIIIFVHFYFGPAIVMWLAEIVGIFFCVMIVWGLIMVTTAVANKHTQRVVKDVTQSIVDAQYADDRGEVARMIALSHKRNMLDHNNQYGYPMQPPMPSSQYPAQGMIPYAHGNYPLQAPNDRFDYDGHLNYGDAWFEESSGLK